MISPPRALQPSVMVLEVRAKRKEKGCTALNSAASGRLTSEDELRGRARRKNTNPPVIANKKKELKEAQESKIYLF